MDLPDDVVLQILSCFNYRNLLDLKPVSKTFDPVLSKAIRKCFRDKTKALRLTLNTYKEIVEYLNDEYENDDLYFGDIIWVNCGAYIYNGQTFETILNSRTHIFYGQPFISRCLPSKFRIIENGVPKDYWNFIGCGNLSYCPNLNLSLIADQIRSVNNVKLINNGLTAIVPVTVYGQKYYFELPSSKLKSLAGIVNIEVEQYVIKIY